MHQYNLTLDVPENVRTISNKDLVVWAGDRIKSAGSFTPMQVMNILNNIFLKMGLKLDSEQMLFLLDDSKRLLCEASAGSGKTTVSQLKMLKYKLLYGIDGSDILTIAYNDHAVTDMEKRHRYLVENINAQGIEGVKLNDRIVCRTFHSNALAWVTEYGKKCGIENREAAIISDLNEERFMEKALDSALKKFVKDTNTEEEVVRALVKPSTVPALVKFNSFMEEKLLKVEDWEGNPQFEEIGLPVNIVKTAIARFNKTCEFNSMYTFSKILVKFYELLRDNDDIRDRVQKAYKVLLVDEYQDMSPLMNEIISLMINDDTIFNAIGDGDQAIYAFKGTDGLNCLKFRQYFPDGKVVSMGANRRCRKAIVDVARNILSVNKLRYPKELYSTNDGGEVKTKGYDTVSEEINYIINELKQIPNDKLYDVCIAYRNKESSALLTKMLLDARIPFKVSSGYSPYKDTLSSSLFEVFAMLKNSTSKAYHERVLFKLTPATRAQVASVLATKSEADGLVHYLDYNWDMLGSNLASIMKNRLAIIKECEDALKADAPMCNYFGKIFNLFKLYYWNWYSEQKKFSKELEENIVKDYSTTRSYKVFLKEYMEQVSIRDKFARTGVGVTLTTFHGLKGLEFSKVFLIDLDDSIFPCYDKIEKDCKGNTQAELEAKEECVRLFYVACTRPKDSLTVLYNNENPSILIDLLNVKTTTKKDKVAEQEDNDDDIDLSDYLDDDFFEGDDAVMESEEKDIVIEDEDEDIFSNFEVPEQEEIETPEEPDEELDVEEEDNHYNMASEFLGVTREQNLTINEKDEDVIIESRKPKSKLEGTLGIMDFLSS